MWLQNDMKLIGLVLLVFAIVALEFIGVIANVSCFLTLCSTCTDMSAPVSQMLKIVVHSKTMSSTITTVTFCHQFRVRRFIQSAASLITL